MIGKTISSRLLNDIAVIVNSALAHDKLSLRALRELSGTKIQIISNSPHFTVYLRIDEDQVTLSNEGDVEQTITLSGSLVALLSTLFGADEINTLAGTGLIASGDTGVLRKLSHLMTGLSIDWEALLGDFIGPMPAHFLSSVAGRIRPAIARNRKRICEVAVEVAQEEFRITPSKVEFDHFAQRIQGLSAQVDRTEAHLNAARRILIK